MFISTALALYSTKNLETTDAWMGRTLYISHFCFIMIHLHYENLRQTADTDENQQYVMPLHYMQYFSLVLHHTYTNNNSA